VTTGARKPPNARRLELVPITRDEAFAYIAEHHRHLGPPVGWRFGVAVHDGERIVGVVAVGRPIARFLDDGWTAEVTRCCTDGTPNASSILYGAAWRAARALGYRRLVTYTLRSEPGTSLRAAGFAEVARVDVRGRLWDRPGRPRVEERDPAQRRLWEMTQ
jgi:hypothetical protein